MGHYQDRPSFAEIQQIPGNDSFIVGIQRVGSLIKKHERRVLIERTGDKDTLFLSPAQPHAFSPHHRLVFQGQFLYELFQVGLTGGGPETCTVYMLVLHRNVPCQRFGKHMAVLQHYAAAVPPRCHIIILQGSVPQKDISACRSKIAQQQFDKGGLSTSACAHDGSGTLCRNGQRYVIQHLGFAMQVIFKIQVFNPDILSGNLRLFRYLFPPSFLRFPMNRADTLNA